MSAREIQLSDLDAYLAAPLWGPAAYKFVRDAVDYYYDQMPEDVEQWADECADSDVIYYSDALELWTTLNASDYADPHEIPQYTTAQEAITAEAFMAARAVYVAVATFLSEQATDESEDE